MQGHNISKPHLYAMYLSAFSMLMLAAALVYFTIELVNITRQIPEILLTVERTSEKIGPVVEEVGEIRGLVPPILKEIEETRKLVPPILKEIEETRKIIKPAINEYAKTNEQIPRILDEVEATRKALPEVLKTADKASSAVMAISKEVEKTRPLITEALAEVEKTRESIPPMMDRADQLILKASEAGKEASEGAVTGVFSGILMAPFTLVGDAGKRLVGASEKEAEKLSAEDYTLVETTVNEILERGRLGEVKEWRNEKSGSSGKVKLININDELDDGDECRELQITVENKGHMIQDKSSVMCKDYDGKWDLE